MKTQSSNDDLPSMYEEMVKYPGKRVLLMTKMSQQEILEFYKYVVSKIDQNEIYSTIARELEEEEIVQFYLDGLIEYYPDQKREKPQLTVEEQQEIAEVINLLNERRKERNNPFYKLYRKFNPTTKSRSK